MPEIAGARLRAEKIRELESAILSSSSINEAATKAGVYRATVAKHLRWMRSEGRVGLLGASAEAAEPSPVSPIEVKDAAFWRRKATEAMKRADESEHILREMAGIANREIHVPDWALPDAKRTGQAVGLIHLSDLHVGEVVRPEEVGGLNEYNPDVFRRRFRRMIAAAIEILPRWASDCNLRGVVMALNGDLISGSIHDELREENALTAHEQVALATDEIAAAITKIADRFGAVMVTVTPGNHGRTTDKTHAKRMAALSYDTMIGSILQREFKSDSRVAINLSAGADLLFPVLGWSVLQTHGDSIGTGGGFGFAGPELPIVRGGKKIKLAGFAAGEKYDIILVGHYHTSSNPGTVLANGSMTGYSEFAVRIRGTPEPPQQWLALIHERWGLRERVPVVLEDPRAPDRPRVRVPAGMAVEE